MKVLLLHNRYQQAGGEDASVEAERDLLLQYGHEAILIEADNSEIDTVGKQITTAFGVVYSPSARRRIAQEIAQFRPDVVHVQNFFPLFSPSVYYACQKARVPVVQTLRNYRLICPNGLLFRDGQVCEECVGQAFAWPGVAHGCYRNSMVGTASIATMQAVHRIAGTWNDRIDSYIALTDFSRNIFVKGGLPSDKIRVKPNYIPHNGKVGDGRGGYALFVGRLSPEKGLDTILTAWKTLGNRIPLRIVGEGPLAERVRSATDQHISYLGPLRKSAILSLMRDATCLVFPSLWFETFGRVIAEAFSTGLPVVASDLGSSLVTHGKTGLLFRTGEPRLLVQEIEWILSHPEELSVMRRCARQEYEDKYTPERNYELLMQIYDRVLHRTDKAVLDPVTVCE